MHDFYASLFIKRIQVFRPDFESAACDCLNVDILMAFANSSHFIQLLKRVKQACGNIYVH